MNAQNLDWTDVHFAYQVAKNGTLSAASLALGVHHSTVLRRIDALEAQLGVKLFHRHARGYTPTPAGELLLAAADNTQNELDRLLGKLQTNDDTLKGSLKLTTLLAFLPPLTPLLAEFQTLHPEICLEIVATPKLTRFEYGEAHVGIRPGKKPDTPDYVVQHLKSLSTALYASEGYINRNGRMKALDEVGAHRFITVGKNLMNVESTAWIENNVPTEQINHRAPDFNFAMEMAKAGIGIAPCHCWLANNEPTLIRQFDAPEQWNANLWLITHRDLHHSAKVQAFTQFLKSKLRDK
ncbi:LysR family transcriptional regulator [Veronia nyctiphanis]|uniref:LysR family transcriptional regulator n=1 Tax=Veronia nyctiphanis TaxID=1278244 RepID=A0A4Q0YSE2_9GAMM|nr:LysR family transcriptional regulator [Veronia nyctiphanis]RXJ74150.1 LysR family transcriptional regulator [Veronia nyctiphanis]